VNQLLIVGGFIVLTIEIWALNLHLSRKITYLEEVVVPWMMNISTKLDTTPPPPAPPIKG
jgi:hypothetical protein